jgi:putative transposase
VRQARKRPKRKAAKRRRGRPRTPEEIRKIVLRIARETGFGYVRILGELRKLGITGVSRVTVANILKEKGVPTGPQRGEATWTEFLRRHARTLWACDFLTVRVLTPKGLRYAFALVFVHPATRVAHVSKATLRPDADWMAETVRDFLRAARRGGTSPLHMVRDRDSKYAAGFDQALADAGVTTHPLPHRSPNLNAHVERLIQSIQAECLDHFIILGTRHLDHLLGEYIEGYYNRNRPHSALGFAAPAGKKPPVRAGPVEPLKLRCQQRLGGVIKHYHWKAA